MVLAYKNNLMYSNKVDSLTGRKGRNLTALPHIIDKVEHEKVVFMNKKICPICGKEFVTKRNSTIYCSRACFSESQKKYRICPTCGKQFNPHNPKQKYCSISCGIHSRDRHLEGQKFGRWTVLKRAEQQSNNKVARWLCRCECGTEKVVSELNLVRGQSKSCGCLHKDKVSSHQQSYTRIYKIWYGMKRRCNDENHLNYKYYGARGIKVCDEWNDIINFKNWAITNGYQENLTIDRIDTNGNYCPENCRWVDMKTQANNTSRNHYITIDNETHTIAEWARIYNIKRETIKDRISNGWDEIKAVITPIKTEVK